MKYYPAIKRNELSIHVTTLTNLKIIMLSERSQAKKKDIQQHSLLYMTLENEMKRSHGNKNHTIFKNKEKKSLIKGKHVKKQCYKPTKN